MMRIMATCSKSLTRELVPIHDMIKLFQVWNSQSTFNPVARTSSLCCLVKMLAVNYIAIGTVIMLVIFAVLTLVCK